MRGLGEFRRDEIWGDGLVVCSFDKGGLEVVCRFSLIEDACTDRTHSSEYTRPDYFISELCMLGVCCRRFQLPTFLLQCISILELMFTSSALPPSFVPSSSPFSSSALIACPPLLAFPTTMSPLSPSYITPP